MPAPPAFRAAVMAAAIDPTAKLVGLVLAAHMDGKGMAQVSKGRVGVAAGLEAKAVQRAVRRLEAAGLLEVKTVAGGRHVVNRYGARNGVPGDPVSAAMPLIETGSRGTPKTPKTGSRGTPVIEVLEEQTRTRSREGPSTAAQAAAEFRKRIGVSRDQP